MDDSFGMSLRGEANDIESMAEMLEIIDDDGLKQAAEIVKICKKLSGQIGELFEPLRKSTKAAYDAVLNRKKEFLVPVEKADKTVRQKMKEYTDEKVRKQREEEEKRRIEAEKAAEEKRKQAEMMEAEDEIMAEFMRLDADMMGQVVSKSPEKVEGVMAIRSWEIESIDDAVVPVSFNGVIIRPVDIKAVEKMIRESKGTVEIPGVKYKETHIMRIQ